MKRRKLGVLATGALASALVLGGIGYAYGETADGQSSAGLAGAMGRAGGGLVRVVADLTGIDPSDVAQRRSEGESFAAIAQSESVSTDAVKDAAVAEFEASLDERLSSTEPVRGHRGGRGGMGRFGLHPVSVLAELSGLDESEIREAREGGTSLADIAKAEGVEADALIDAIIKQAEEGLQTAVADGRVEADRVDEMLEHMRSRLEQMVTETEWPPARGGRGGPFGDTPAEAAGEDV